MMNEINDDNDVVISDEQIDIILAIAEMIVSGKIILSEETKP